MGKIGQDLIQDRGIDRDMFCSECGYNLRTLSRIGRCPECGNEYDARPVGTRGILLPESMRFPLDLWFASAVSGSISVLAIIYAMVEKAWWLLVVATPFVFLTWRLVRAAFLNSVKYFRYRAILRASRAEDEDDLS